MTRKRAKKQASANSKRAEKAEAKERCERRNLAIGLSVASVLSFGGLLALRQQSLTQTGHFRVSVLVLVVLAFLALFNLYAVYDWFRHR